MSANYLHTIADENPNLHKQLGCMNGLFQIFNRQHFIRDRHISCHSTQRLHSGESGNPGRESNSSSMLKATEKNLEGVKESERTSVELSRSSFSSSSCSSTFSSIDCNKLAQPDLSILSYSPLPKTPSHVVPQKQPDPSFQQSQPSNIRNFMKDSIQRETHKLSVKTKTKSESKNRVMKHIDSPRPQQVFKTMSPRVSAHDPSSRVLGRERNSTLPAKDAPRFSYDERETRYKWKSVAKLRELPRFSLDSRESSIRKADSEPRSSSLLEDLQQRRDQRFSGVVAKLMGLEAFPDPKDTNKSRTHKNLDPISTSSSKKAEENNHNQISNSPRFTPKDASSPKLRNINSSAKLNPRVQLEPAPRRQTNGNQESENRAVESQPKPQTLYPSVYGQIENRLTELEFKKSGKDLRALKQILEAMQKAREIIEDKKEESSNKQSQIGNLSSSTETTPTIKGSDSPKKLEVSFAMGRSAKAVHKPKISVSSAQPIEGVSCLHKLRTRENAHSKKELIPRNNQFKESSQQSLLPKDNRSSAAIYRSKQTSVSPRMQSSKHRVEKKSHPITNTSQASTPRRTVNWDHTKTFSPSSNIKSKSHVWQQGDGDQLSEINSKTRCLSHEGDDSPALSESNISTASQNDEVTSNYRSKKAARWDEFRLKSGTTPATLEQPSPVSVLDTTFYTEESPSPVKKISKPFIDEDNLSSDEAESDPVDLKKFLKNTRPDLLPEFNRDNLKKIKHFNDKLRKVGSRDEADADSIAIPCESADPMHRYIAEILSASGLFKDLENSLTFTQLHPSECLINPYLFHILEQAKSRFEVQDDEQSEGKKKQSKLQEKIQRKLVFDTTNEILVHLLISAGFSDLCISSNKLGLRSLTGKKFLERICSEMDHLQTNLEYSLPYEDDALHTEIPGLALDIERLIFKDLISEIVSSEAGLPRWLNKHRRKLFTS